MRKLIKLLQTNDFERTLLHPETMGKPNNAKKKKKNGKKNWKSLKDICAEYFFVSLIGLKI